MKVLQIIKPGVAALLLVGLSLQAFSQKLSDVQKSNLRAPEKVKIDGNLNEWGDTFQAYNNSTNVFYTMANDDKNLYLIIKSADKMNNVKIMTGGINFTVNTEDKKIEKDAYTIVFPLIDRASLRSQIGSPTLFPDSARLATMNKQILASAKEIKLIGFTADVPDTLISVYNEYNIKAAVGYDNKGSLVYELAIPLKYLHLSTKNAKEFTYHIKLNGPKSRSGANDSAIEPPAGGESGGGVGGGMRGDAAGGLPPELQAALQTAMQRIQNVMSPTDFWDKYLLAK